MPCNHSMVKTDGKCYYCNEVVAFPPVIKNQAATEAPPSVPQLKLNLKPSNAPGLRPGDVDELMLVAFYEDQYVVLYTCGDTVSSELRELGCRDMLEYTDGKPGQGIWVWEGKPKADCMGDEFDGYLYADLGWRSPSPAEWASIMKNKNPWE